ncbi:unnamed protein product [Dibothriocephalus latus]|uniref:Uncharacterized protein n=1 Tax=Dibothriocephalus latus TaxID=60516 RepID=A0A3P7PIT5_DIBLA|nr:unnamed protein product [Dibothriocephalus latus]
MLPPILTALSKHQIPERDRLNLLDDHFALIFMEEGDECIRNTVECHYMALKKKPF